VGSDGAMSSRSLSSAVSASASARSSTRRALTSRGQLAVLVVRGLQRPQQPPTAGREVLLGVEDAGPPPLQIGGGGQLRLLELLGQQSGTPTPLLFDGPAPIRKRRCSHPLRRQVRQDRRLATEQAPG